MMTFENWLHSQLPAVPRPGAQAVLRLAEEGATVPFIARYRKEQTGGLDEVAIQKVIDAKERWDQVLKRQGFIVEEIERQKKLTDELKAQILSTFKLEELEDIYLPYKQKRRTKAQLAREAGLEPLADWIWNTGHGLEKPLEGQTLEIWAYTFRNEEKGFNDAQAAIEGATDILIERLSEMQHLRQAVRSAVFEKGSFVAKKGGKAKPSSKYENYFDYREPFASLLKPENSHRYLAVRRGWMEEELSLGVGGPVGGDDGEFEGGIQRLFEAEACPEAEAPGAAALMKAAKLAFRAHVYPSIEGEAHKALKDVADAVAISVFAENLRKLLLASPFGSKAVLGVDPGIRTGCKLAVVDDSGKYMTSTVMHLQTEDGRKQATQLLLEVAKNAAIQAVAVGNGTAGREAEIFIRKTFKDAGITIPVVMVSEAGASVYSASDVAREEFPDLDVTVRGAISIARRLQDPLAELVKIDPKSIGVGQYQHDVSPNSLKRSLDLVVDSCVNAVGVELNTASKHLLAHVSGIGPALAEAVVTRREARGLFKSRDELLEVPRFSKKAFEQAAGFLRIHGAEHPLDATGVHPERYGALEEFARKSGKALSDLLGREGVALLKASAELKSSLGEFTFEDVIKELEKPGRDPRESFVPFSFRDDIHELKDLKPTMVCPGIVTNVTAFGAFVDIGVHQDGLVHISQLSNRFVKDPHEVVSAGDRVTVTVLEVNLEKKQIALTMKGERQKSERPKPERDQAKGRASRPGPRREARERGGERGGKPAGRPAQHGKPRPPAPQPSGGKAVAPRSASRPERQKPAFNNPFGSLASLRDSLKPK
jgi:protein Tex